MRFDNLVPMLWVNDIGQTVRFYEDLLGFKCVNRIEQWACLRKDKVELMLSTPNAHEPYDKIQFTGSFYFYPENVDELWATVKDRATIVYPIENFDYGMREFAIRDNNGYILQFGQEISSV
jgi:uncharacterized glyoxalase superfamily protein PhnB